MRLMTMMKCLQMTEVKMWLMRVVGETTETYLQFFVVAVGAAAAVLSAVFVAAVATFAVAAVVSGIFVVSG